MLWPPLCWVLLHLMLSDIRLTAIFLHLLTHFSGNPTVSLPQPCMFHSRALHPQSVDSLHPRWVERPVNSCSCHSPDLLPRGHLYSACTGDRYITHSVQEE
ncbi:hypothetical protein BaRGS_00039782 [Batillaria attramentaria]|uniref:Secreted protein n=1 Tax=Batillaria attramentaria TaxID=370345 RepID=A0ABD0J352_9CAEN